MADKSSSGDGCNEPCINIGDYLDDSVLKIIVDKINSEGKDGFVIFETTNKAQNQYSRRENLHTTFIEDICFWGTDGLKERIKVVSQELAPDDLASVPKNSPDWWRKWSITPYVVNNRTDRLEYVFLSHERISDEELASIMGLMVKYGALSKNFNEDDLAAFFAECISFRFNLWAYAPFLPDSEKVTHEVIFWWRKYIESPQYDDDSLILLYCGFLVRARLLPEHFSLTDFLRTGLELNQYAASISVRYEKHDSNFVSFQVTLKAIEEAERLGILSFSSKDEHTAEPPPLNKKRKKEFDTRDFKSIPELANKYKIATYRDAFAKRLERWGNDNPEGIETRLREGRPKNEPHVFYHEPSVRHICEEYVKKG